MPLPPNLQLMLQHGLGGYNHHRVVSTEADICLGSELFSDLRLESPDGVVGCHQSLLAPLSPLLRSILASYPPFPGLVHTVVLPIKVDIVKSVLKIIYTGDVTLPSQAHMDQVMCVLKLFGIHLPGLQSYRPEHDSHIQSSNNNIETPSISAFDCGKRFNHKKSLELHRIEYNCRDFEYPSFSSAEEPAICDNNDDTNSPNKRKRKRDSFNNKVTTKVTEAGPKAPLICNLCQAALPSQWHRHPQRHNCSSIPEKNYSCEKCCYTLSSLVEMRSHYTASHYWDQIEAQFARWGSRCYICLIDFKTSKNLVKHLGNFHSYVDQCLVKENLNYIKDKEKIIKLLSLECGYCGEVMPTSGELKNHLSCVHLRKELGREFPEYSTTQRKKNRCHLCGKNFISDLLRIRHIGSFHDHALKYAKHLITVTDVDAKLIPENDFGEGLNESAEPFEEDQIQVAQFLTDWLPLFVSKLAAPGATKPNYPSEGTTTIEHREAGSCSIIDAPEQSALHRCPLTNCARQCSNKANLRVHLAVTHYMDELEKEYCTGNLIFLLRMVLIPGIGF